MDTFSTFAVTARRADDVLLAARTILTQNGFAIVSRDKCSASLTGPGLNSTRQNPLLGASAIHLELHGQQLHLDAGAILSAEIHQATESDSGTLEASLRTAQAHLKDAGTYRSIEEVAADKGYHKGEALEACGLLNGLGIRTYVPEPESKYERKWTDKSPLERKAVENNRRRMKRTYGKGHSRAGV